ncbi:oxygen-independent coproporphyrinogen III oxidase [Peptacetobacter hominis]|uniref:Heme chaperone HemW n=1 Tax=Peptacetobacter hominis TaxID=2743610 RepID=A0A544QYK8_9FIRM|nr:radical SAM family heme chaperone HemW [Peptacetobacter hominis]TQQ85718.1 oxygen-independent coproporphyrinogen III oxidase [Peptacetobacter hominis]
MYGIYIHIPFCVKKCRYCDFNSYKIDIEKKKRYIKALEKEIEIYSKMDNKRKIDTIFLGGGTPSILKPDEIESIFEKLNSSFDISEDAEITMECNPGTLDEEKLNAMKKSGVNRLSIGLQAVQNDILEYIGRIHTFEEFEKTYNLVRKCGFDDVNIDLMYNLPNQREKEWMETLEKVVSLNPEHISAYSLILEEGTELCDMYERGEFTLSGDDTDIKMYRYTIDYLKKNGYMQYEISNYAKPGKECRHNIIYWKCDNYIGLGAGASGYIGNRRYSNIPEVDEYNETVEAGKLPVLSEEVLTDEEKFEELVFMGLRMNEGVLYEDFEKISGIDIRKYRKEIIERLKKDNLIECDENRIKLTQSGREISNKVFLDIICG